MSNVAKSANNRKDLSGQTFGKLKVIEYSHTTNKRAFWKCRCECGNEHIAMGKYLICGDTRSCGCLVVEVTSSSHLTHGESRGSRTKEYRAWSGIKTRCYSHKNHKYPIYGGRGITMCDKWRLSYVEFLKDVGRAPTKSHSIDRIKVNGNYEPGNCKWSTPKEQARNTRRFFMVEVNGVSKMLSEWCEEYGQNYHLVYHRIKKCKWDALKALTTRSRAERPI